MPLNLWQKWQSVTENPKALVVYGLLPHENQMCVVNAVLKRTPDSTIPIKSKERLIVQCGYRRFIVNPVFSQHTNSDRHKVRIICSFTMNKQNINHIIYLFSMNGISVQAKL